MTGWKSSSLYVAASDSFGVGRTPPVLGVRVGAE